MESKSDLKLALTSCLDRVQEWQRQYISDSFVPLHAEGQPNLLATCFAILGAECCGTLESLQPSSKESLVNLIQNQQDQTNGIFKTFEIKRKDLGNHSATYIGMQSTYFAIHALDALGAKPKYPIAFANQLKNKDYTNGWLDGGNWGNPWMHSNNVMFALTFLQTEASFSLDAAPSDSFHAFHYILDYLDARQDPVSGLWQPDSGRDDRNAVFAAYHFFPYYYYSGRPLQHQEQIIDTLLTMIQPDGFFGSGIGRSGACEDLDVIHSLVLLASSNQHRRAEVKSVLKTTLEAHFKIQSDDGGFPNYMKVRPQLHRIISNPRLLKSMIFGSSIWRYSGWKLLECPKSVSDTWGGWFRPLSIRLIGEFLFPEDNFCVGGNYRKLPGLGWHFSSPKSFSEA